MWTYEETHPWIEFSVDLRRLQPHDWLLLGEARSKCEHVAGVPLLPDVARQLHRVSLIKGAAATTAIEGNTLTEAEVGDRVDGIKRLPASREYLGVEVDNVVAAYNLIVSELPQGELHALTPDRIRQMNTLVLEGLELEDDVVPGQVRTHGAGVPGYRGAPAEECDYLLARLCEWLESDDFHHEDDAWAFCLVCVRAVIAHLYIEWIHPFGDGNGRTGRLVEYQLLLASGFVPSPAAHLLSNHYNLTRPHYYRALDQARQKGPGELAFVRYALEGFVDGLREQLSMIGAQLMAVMWRDYVHDRLRDGFRNVSSAPAVRARELVLALSEPTERSRLTQLSPEVARLYAAASQKTLTRDLHAVEALGLVVRDGELFRPKRESLLSFLPLQAPREGTSQAPGQA
jgi:Fic family protein